METNTTQAFSFPKPTGIYAVGTTSFYLTDPKREEIYTEDPNDYREIAVKVWYPSQEIPGAVTAPYMSEELSRALASGLGIPPQDFVNFTQSVPTNSVLKAPVSQTESKYPVLFFSHGRNSLPEFSTFQAEELASQGYIVVAINHTYESGVSIFPDGRVIPTSPIFDEAERDGGINSEFLELLGQSVAIKAEDARFVLDELEKFNAGNDPTGLFSGKLDLDRVGIYGHSTGGATAAKVLSIDPRFQAGINLDGSLYGDVVNASLSQPFMTFLNEGFGTKISDDEVSRQLDERYFTLLTNLQDEGYQVTVLGTTHPHFASDVPFLFPLLLDSGIEIGDLKANIDVFFNGTGSENFQLIDPNRFTQIVNDYTTAFFDRYLNNQESPLLADSSFPLTDAYPEVIAQLYKGDNILADRDGNDLLIGEQNNNLLYGGRGDDVLKGRDGIDSLYGGGGNDFLYGGRGNDYLFGQDGNDFLHGGEGDDFLYGVEGDDVLKGGNGNDSLIGSNGKDTISGGKGNDILSGGADDDRLIDTQGNNILYGDAGNDWLQVSQGNNKLEGDSGNDILIGGVGDDLLNGGMGNDLLIGSSGCDRFYLSSGQDNIKDFQDGQDLLGLPTTINGIPLTFNDLNIVQIGQNTEIRWKSDGLGNLENQTYVTTLEGIQASQITVNNFI